MLRKINLGILLIFLTINVQGQEPFKVFLIGDAGEPYIGDHPTMKLLRQKITDAGEKSAVIFLGDNIYPKGMPDINEKGRAEAEQAILGQVEILKEYPGKIIFVPGNHDWEKGSEGGLQRLINQEQFIERNLNNDQTFFPGNGCSGPVSIDLSSGLMIIIYDSQWLLHPHQKNGSIEGCSANSNHQVITQIKQTIQENKDKKIIIASHHPLITYGIHGGVTTFKDHLFPLTNINKALYVPLPVIGSFYPLARKIGNIQDTNHPIYRGIIQQLQDVYSEHPGLMVVAGHEHSLQYINKEGIHYIVSGAGVKTTHVKKKGFAEFVANKTGFAIITIYSDRAPLLEFWQASKGVPDDLLFETELPPE